MHNMPEKEEKSAGNRSNEADPAESLIDAGSGVRPPADSDSDSNSSATITVLRPHDILLGRGSGCNDYEGNVRFRSLVENRKREYLSAAKREDKRRIAQEIFDQITIMNGGRFLKKEAKRKVNGVIINRGVHIQVGDKVAMEKVKQALRENWQNWQPQDDDTETNETINHHEDRTHDQNLRSTAFRYREVASASNGSAIQGFGSPQVNHFGNLSDPLQLTTLVRSTVNPASTCAQLLLFQSAQLALQQQPTLLRSLLLQQSLEQLADTTESDQPSTVSQNRDLSGYVYHLPARRSSSYLVTARLSWPSFVG